MKALLAVVIVVLAVVLVFAALRHAPAPKPTPPPVAPTAAVTATATTQPPTQVVKGYLTALYSKNYGTAYRLLSKDSQKAYPFDAFVKLNEQKGTTQFDLATAKEEPGGGKGTTVNLSLKEDVAQHSFPLIQETGKWRIVFLKGTPSFPYAE